MTTKTLSFALAILIAAHASSAQSSSWTSTDVGAVTLAGSASETNGAWTVTGDGSDIWGTADSFQFLHKMLTSAGVLTVRINDLQNTSPFTKAGLMFRSSLNADAATFLLGVKPNGEVELLERASDGASMQYLGGATLTLPAWLRLEHTLNGGTSAWTSQDGFHWSLLREEIPVQLGHSLEAGVAVTSHDSAQLNTAHFDHLNLDALQSGWASKDIGDVDIAGTDSEADGQWTVTAAGKDVWGTADSFHFVYINTAAKNQHVVVRVDGLGNTSEFAKAGIMLRSSVDPGAPTVILDMKPDGGIEYMARPSWAGEMSFFGGLAPPPVPRWLDLAWQESDPGYVSVTARASSDKINWVNLGPPITIPWSYLMEVGLAVTSHAAGQATTAQFDGLSVLELGASSDDIGNVQLVGNAVSELTDCCGQLIVEGAGSDIWGTADSFEFLHGAPDTTGNVHAISSRVASLQADHPFAKAGLMYRDSLGPDAAQVIVDTKPDGGVEFMARLCTGCETTFIGGTAPLQLPLWLTLFREGSTFHAVASSNNGSTRVDLGTVDVPMAAPYVGYAVTSHVPAHVATAIFDDPPR
jgi:hypothetical protein